MAAAMASMDIIEEEGVIEKIAKLGASLRKGLTDVARESKLNVVYTGTDPIPFMRFEDDPVFDLNRLFCGEAAKRGIFFHPHHNWFLSAAHTEADIDKTLEVSREAFKAVSEHLATKGA
jgi:glutamate-1-semialdehyde 2,1-aminomutase